MQEIRYGHIFFVYFFRHEIKFDAKLLLFQIVECLNKLSTTNCNPTQKTEQISMIQELILHSDIELLDEFIDDVLTLAFDANQDVRKSVAGFIEEVW